MKWLKYNFIPGFPVFHSKPTSMAVTDVLMGSAQKYMHGEIIIRSARIIWCKENKCRKQLHVASHHDYGIAINMVYIKKISCGLYIFNFPHYPFIVVTWKWCTKCDDKLFLYIDLIYFMKIKKNNGCTSKFYLDWISMPLCWLQIGNNIN